MADAVVMLEVPIEQKDEAKALGARWNPDARSWYVPAGRDATPFARWLPPPVPTDGPMVPARLLGQVERCYRCGARGVALTGILVSPVYSIDPSGFVGFDSIARILAALVNDTPLAEKYFIGRIRMRSSYVANACRQCDAMWGSFPLREAVIEYLAGGGSFTKMVIGELDFPALALPDIRIVPHDPGLYDEEDDPDLYDEEDAAGQDDPIALPRSEPVALPANPTVTAITDALPPVGTARHRRRRSRRR